MVGPQHDRLKSRQLHASGLEILPRPAVDMLAFRRNFIISMGWRDDSHLDDTDRYDDVSAWTLHFGMRDDEGNILSGMRLTKLDSLDSSLSIEMLKSNQAMRDAALEASRVLNDPDTDVWDLTRLVHRLKERGVRESVESIKELFGAGLALTAPDENRKLVWVFTTTEEMKGYLDRNGIVAEVVARGNIDVHDGKDSYFCVIHPVDAMQFLRDNQATYGATYSKVAAGFDAASDAERVSE